MAWIKYERRTWYQKHDKKHKDPQIMVLSYSKDTGPLGLYMVIKANWVGKKTYAEAKEYWTRLPEGSYEYFKDSDGQWDVKLAKGIGWMPDRNEDALLTLKQ